MCKSPDTPGQQSASCPSSFCGVFLTVGTGRLWLSVVFQHVKLALEPVCE